MDEVAAILAENARVRAAGGAGTTDFGRMVLQVPLAVYWELVRVYPALASRDAREKTQAWRKLLGDSDFQKLVVGKG